MSPSLDPRGLRRLHDALAAHVDADALPGVAALVAAGDDVHVEVIGSSRFGGPPLERDAIWRIASLTKPVVAAAALSMLADGTLDLDQAVDDLLPELAGRRVLRAIDAELDDTVPAARPITVGDVLTYRMGLGSVMAPPGSFPIQRAEAALGLRSIGSPPWPPVDHDDDSWIAALGTLPLAHQPGAAWMYNTSGQVLGVLLARADGAPLEAVLRRRILDPLGMTDTSFTIAPDRQARLVTFYEPDPETGGLSVIDDPGDSWWTPPLRFADGSGMLLSTIDDYWAFVAMVRAGGVHRGERILPADLVTRMTTDQLSADQRAGNELFLDVDGGWGLGMGTAATGSEAAPLPCGYGWEGGSGTSWRTHAVSGVTGILLTQRAMTSPTPPPIMHDFWAAVTAAVR